MRPGGTPTLTQDRVRPQRDGLDRDAAAGLARAPRPRVRLTQHVAEPTRLTDRDGQQLAHLAGQPHAHSRLWPVRAATDRLTRRSRPATARERSVTRGPPAPTSPRAGLASHARARAPSGAKWRTQRCTGVSTPVRELRLQRGDLVRSVLRHVRPLCSQNCSQRARTAPVTRTFGKRKSPPLRAFLVMRRRGLEPPPGYPGPGPQPGASTNSAIGARAAAEYIPACRS